MSGEDWERIKRIFDEVLQLPKEDRAAYLELAFKDRPDLRASVEELLDSATQPSVPSEQCHVFSEGDIVASRFRIVRFINAGSMGEVYEAFDERLQVRLALKTLHPDLESAPEATERFRREVAVSLDVTHDNVCRVFGLIEHCTAAREVIPCLTMELIEGETLSEHLQRARPLSPEAALPLLRQIAAGLDVLHDHGIVHRDLKPSNIMLAKRRDGRLRAVVMDFGLAKPETSEKDLFESAPGLRAGAPYFMAPELFREGRHSTASDIYAFGLIADELVTRTRAYTAESVPAMCYAKLCEMPISPGLRADALPEHWEQVILRCLHADAQQRFKSAGDVVNALQAGNAPVTNTNRRPRITRRAVIVASIVLLMLPLAGLAHLVLRPLTTSISVYEIDNQANDSAYDYFCRGTTNELMRRLTRLKGVQIIPMYATRPSPQQSDPSRFALQGMLQAFRTEVRLSVSVIDNTNGTLIWSERFDRKQIEDPLETQSDIAAGTVTALEHSILLRPLTQSASYRPLSSFVSMLRGWIATPEHAEISAAPTVSNAALDRYMRARALVQERSPENIQTGIALLKEAVTEDPKFALAYAALADAYIAYTPHAYTEWPAIVGLARNYGQTAVMLDPNLAESHEALGFVQESNWQWGEAMSQYLEALRLKPGLAGARRRYARLLLQSGRMDEGTVQIFEAARQDPYDPSGPYQHGLSLFIAGRYQDALAILEPAIGRRPDDSNIVHNLSDVYAALASSSMGAAREEYFRKALELADRETALERQMQTPGVRTPWGDKMHAHFYSLQGNLIAAQPYLHRLMEDVDRGSASPVLLAIVLSAQNRKSEAIDLLEKAAATRDPYVAFFKTFPFFAPLRNEPRFQALIARIGI
ncbi:MAG TPA: protein kinase [Terriglobia bacterium]|nr:protein kinase [Terriglobia bacterium]